VTNLAFVDIETTSLERPFSARATEVWEVGLVVRQNAETFPHKDNDIEYRWFLPVSLRNSDPVSLDIGRFHERYPTLEGRTHPQIFCREFNDAIMKGVGNGDTKPHLVGNVVSFDEERLAAIFINSGPPYSDNSSWLPWHYHLVDVEAMVAGRLGLQPPWSSKDLTAALGVPVPEGQHDALVDARWARDIYDAVFNHWDRQEKDR